MQLIDTIFQFCIGLFFAYCKLILSFVIICLVGAVPVGIVKEIVEKVREKWKIKI